MSDGTQGNAMTEIALAMAMGFFAVMVLTMMSMGAGGRDARAVAAAMLTPAAADAPAAQPLHKDDVLVIYDGKRFLDRDLTAVDPDRLAPTSRVILAVDPALGAGAEADRERTLARLAVAAPFILYAGALEPRKNLPRLLAALTEAHAAVGYRVRREDGWLRRISSTIANGVRNRLTGDDIIDTGCTLKAYRRDALAELKLLDGMHRFLPTLLRMEGARITELPVHHRPRQHGQSKYGIGNRLFVGLADVLAVRWMQSRALRYQVREEPTRGGSRTEPDS